MIAFTDTGYTRDRVQELTVSSEKFYKAGLIGFIAYRPWEMVHANWVSRLTILGKVWMETYTYMVFTELM